MTNPFISDCSYREEVDKIKTGKYDNILNFNWKSITRDFNIDVTKKILKEFSSRENIKILEAIKVTYSLYQKGSSSDFLDEVSKLILFHKAYSDNVNKQALSSTFLSQGIDTVLARKIYTNAIKAGLMLQQGNHYKWLDKSKSRLAYMLKRIYCNDDNDFPEQELNRLFQEDRLGKALSQLMNNKGINSEPNSAAKPRGYKKIDILFDEEEA